MATRPHATSSLASAPLGTLLAVMLLAIAPASLMGCGGSSRVRRSGDAGSAFSPAAVRIHPLTHVEFSPADPASGSAADRSTLILHLEVLDAWADTTKALGTLRVDLFRPGPGVAPGIETQTLAWDVTDLQDPETNSRRYDRATRTYRLPLRGPAWMSAWLDREAAVRENRPAWLRVRVFFQPLGTDPNQPLAPIVVAEGTVEAGDESTAAVLGPVGIILRDEFVLQR